MLCHANKDMKEIKKNKWSERRQKILRKEALKGRKENINREVKMDPAGGKGGGSFSW